MNIFAQIKYIWIWLTRRFALPFRFALPDWVALISDRIRGLLPGYPLIQPLIRRSATTSPKGRSECSEFPTPIRRKSNISTNFVRSHNYYDTLLTDAPGYRRFVVLKIIVRPIRPESIESISFERANTILNCLNAPKPNRFTNKLDQNRHFNTKDETS